MTEIKDLKSYAYDCFAQIEHWQRELKKANDAIEQAILAQQKEIVPVENPQTEAVKGEVVKKNKIKPKGE